MGLAAFPWGWDVAHVSTPKINMTHSVLGSWCPFTKVLQALMVVAEELSFLACTAAGMFLGSVSVPFLPIYLQESLTQEEVTHSISEALPISSVSTALETWTNSPIPFLPPLLPSPCSLSPMSASWSCSLDSKGSSVCC